MTDGWVPGGQSLMGAEDANMADTKPWRRVYVDGYWSLSHTYSRP
jgi:hypothetical protein